MPFFQAPLSGYTDVPMRRICRDYGAPLAFSGLMLDKSTAYRKVMKKPEFTIGPDDHPIGGQLLGSKPEVMARAAKTLVDFGYDLIDLNFACPVPKVLRRGRGGELLKYPDTIADIYRRVRSAVTCPVIMKLRIGFDNSLVSQNNFWQICRQTAQDGIDALVIHGRTVMQRYRGKADWDLIYQVKREFPNLTVIGSGDLFTAEDVIQRLADYKVDGVAIARGGVGNPWIFRDARALIAGGEKPAPPSVVEQGQVFTRHLEMIIQFYDERKVVPYFRKFCVYYAKHHPQRKKVIMDLLKAQTIAELRQATDKWYGTNNLSN